MRVVGAINFCNIFDIAATFSSNDFEVFALTFLTGSVNYGMCQFSTTIDDF